MIGKIRNFDNLFRELQTELIEEEPFNVGEWQSQKLDDNPMLQMRELLNVSFEWQMPYDENTAAIQTGAHLPWAEDHFKERVSRDPLNPPPSNEWWPFAQKSNKEHKPEGEAFSHTYPERFWPTWAGPNYADMVASNSVAWEPMQGIRFAYGDLDDVVNLLINQPNTRQAFLPVWFPEDTGVVHGKRVPCTLGYHFMIRNGELQITYYMRSCDLVRHFQDDVYMAVRLAQWVRDEIADSEGSPSYKMGKLVMHIANLHVFEGDIAMMKYRQGKGMAWST